MTLPEFKAWFEGFTELMDGPPNKKQWERIKERIALVDGTVLTREVIYRDHYWPRYLNVNVPYWSNPVYFHGSSPTVSSAAGSGGVGTSNVNMMANAVSGVMDLGRADYKSLAQG